MTLRATLRDKWVSLCHALPPFRGRLAIARIVGERLLTTRRNPLAWATLPNGLRFKMYLRWRDYDSLYYFRTYEERLTSLIRGALEGDGASLVDVGANVGVFCMQAADVLRRRGGRALAIEPLPANFAFLEESIAANDLESVVIPARVAAGDSEGTLDLWTMSTGTIANALPLSWRAEGEQQPPDAERATVPMRTLDALIAEYGVTNVKFVKIDVEGAELFVLGGARALLLRDRPLVYCEMHRAFSAANRSTLADLTAFAESVAYDVRYLAADGTIAAAPPDDASQALDAILVPRV